MKIAMVLLSGNDPRKPSLLLIVSTNLWSSVGQQELASNKLCNKILIRAFCTQFRTRFMSAKRRIDLVKYFLLDSPAAHSRAINNLFSPQHIKAYSFELPTDKEYATRFLNRLQSLPPVFISENDSSSQLYQLFFNSQTNFQKEVDELSEQAEQLCCAIGEVSSQKNQSITVYQELEQLLTLATSQTIIEIKKQLGEVFKFLLGRRDEAEELELEANLQVSDVIIQAVTRASEGDLQPQWKQLEAMEKLLRAKSYHKKGLKQKALNNFKQICTDSTASTKTRFQALRVLCVDSEEVGDTSVLESLMNEMHSRGEKRYEQYIRENITRIKAVGGGRSGELV